MSKHTPGPWKIEVSEHSIYVFAEDPAKQHPYKIIANFSTMENNGLENAKLIASAPEMLEALQAAKDLSDKYYSEQLEMYETLERTPECQAVYNQVQAAINKATV